MSALAGVQDQLIEKSKFIYLFFNFFINLYFYLNRPMWLTGTTVDGIDTARTWGLAILSWKEEKQGKLKTPEGQNAGPIPTPLCILNFRYQLNS